ncbi:MAG: CesT family type III secretion system chaperone [Pseudomonadota bacterium]
MSYEKYCVLIDDICAIMGHAHPRQLYDNANITAFGTSFSFMHGGVSAPDHCVVFCDFGPLPDHPADVASFECVKLLLVANVDMAKTRERGSFSLNAVTGHIIFSSLLPLNGLTGTGLMSVLEHFADQLGKWKHYLYGGETARGDVPDMAMSGAPAHGRGRQAMLLKNFPRLKI